MNIRTTAFALAILGCMLAMPLTAIAQEAGPGKDRAENFPGDNASVDWTTISTLDLETAVQIALAGNPSIGAAAARVHQARALVDQARSAYWPRLDANGSGARVRLSDTVHQKNLALARLYDSNATIDDPEDTYTADLTASWTLFDGFDRKFTDAAARYGEQSSVAALNDTRRLLISAVALSFFSAQLALENIAIAKADEQFNQRQLADARTRQRVGTGPLSDVLNFQVRKNQAKTTRINQEYRYKVSLYGLAALMGLPRAHFPDQVKLARLSPETPAELAAPAVDRLIAEAMKHRPDIQQTQWSIKQSTAQVKVAQSGYYPTIVLSGSLNGQRTGNARFGQDDIGNQVQVALSYNLFAGGYTRARVREARQRKVELQKNLQDLKLSTASDIRSAAQLVTTAQTQVTLQRENVALVQRTRDLVEKEYLAGQGSLVRLNEAQKDLTTAQSNLALALVGLRQAWVELKTRTGNILAVYKALPLK